MTFTSPSPFRTLASPSRFALPSCAFALPSRQVARPSRPLAPSRPSVPPSRRRAALTPSQPSRPRAVSHRRRVTFALLCAAFVPLCAAVALLCAAITPSHPSRSRAISHRRRIAVAFAPLSLAPARRLASPARRLASPSRRLAPSREAVVPLSPPVTQLRAHSNPVLPSHASRCHLVARAPLRRLRANPAAASVRACAPPCCVPSWVRALLMPSCRPHAFALFSRLIALFSSPSRLSRPCVLIAPFSRPRPPACSHFVIPPVRRHAVAPSSRRCALLMLLRPPHAVAHVSLASRRRARPSALCAHSWCLSRALAPACPRRALVPVSLRMRSSGPPLRAGLVPSLSCRAGLASAFVAPVLRFTRALVANSSSRPASSR
ncbi:hypothetical protein DENSPDRAFT_886314 [Dentipellis sp. KUC8613]|nr:hypothetical protein DENSPDRAFT_886314 [Dentipellis sp. KUC8613]